MPVQFAQPQHDQASFGAVPAPNLMQQGGQNTAAPQHMQALTDGGSPTPPPGSFQIQQGGQNAVAHPTGPTNGALHQNNWQPSYATGPAASWHPQDNQNYGGQQPLPQWGGAQQLGQQQSIEQQALGGGDDAQRTQDFLRALTAAGAGGNNGFANSGNPMAQQAQPLLGAPAQGNGNAGTVGYTGGFNGGMGNVSYNSGSNMAATQNGMPSQSAGTPAAQQAVYGNGGGNSTQGAGVNQNASPQHYSNQYTQQSPSGPGQVGQYSQSQPQWNMNSMQLVSDETQKTAVKEADISPFLATLGAHSYEYKDEKHGKGRFVSPMAQELEKTAIGRSAVVETPEGKQVQYARLAGVQLSATAFLHRRLEAVEKLLRLKGKK